MWRNEKKVIGGVCVCVCVCNVRHRRKGRLTEYWRCGSCLDRSWSICNPVYSVRTLHCIHTSAVIATTSGCCCLCCLCRIHSILVDLNDMKSSHFATWHLLMSALHKLPFSSLLCTLCIHSKQQNKIHNVQWERKTTDSNHSLRAIWQSSFYSCRKAISDVLIDYCYAWVNSLNSIWSMNNLQRKFASIL